MNTEPQASIKNINHPNPSSIMPSDDDTPMVVIRGAGGKEVSRAEKDESPDEKEKSPREKAGLALGWIYAFFSVITLIVMIAL